MALEPCRFLDWDSNFFHRRIAQIEARRLTEARLLEIETWRRDHQVDCLYFLADPDDLTTTRLAGKNGFDLVDVRITLRRDHLQEGAPSSVEGNVRPARSGDLPRLTSLARSSHLDTRFFFDPRFPDEDCQRLYATWIENSLKGYADALFVAVIKDEAVGYISCHLEGVKRRGRVGLLAVSREARGAGFGKALIGEALSWFEASGAAEVTVATQARNVSAQGLYASCGFRTESHQLWYHRWNGPATGGHS